MPKTITLRVPKEVKRGIERLAKNQNRSTNNLITVLLTTAIQQESAKEQQMAVMAEQPK